MTISLASAISITPNSLDLNLYVGDSYTQQFEIYSEKSSNITIESSNINCLIQESNFSINSGTTYKNLTIYIPFNATPINQDCEFKINFIDIVEVTSSGSHSHHSHNDVINTIKNTTNQSQQENNSNIEGSSSLADNNLPPILNISNDSDYNPSSNELNKQTKEFFKQISDFFKSYWIGISIILLSILLILVSYKVFSKEEPQVEIEMPKYITDKPIEFPQ